MTRSKKLLYTLGGFVLGVLFAAGVWLYADSRPTGNMGGNPTQGNPTEELPVTEGTNEKEEEEKPPA